VVAVVDLIIVLPAPADLADLAVVAQARIQAGLLQVRELRDKVMQAEPVVIVQAVAVVGQVGQVQLVLAQPPVLAE
jgi:hypothetical protein